MRQPQLGNIRIIVLIAVGLVLAGGLYVLTQKPATPIDSLPGQSAESPSQTNNQLPTDLETGQGYVVYSPEAYAAAADKRRVLFFYAAWCPTCRPADKDFQTKAGRIPEDVVLFRLNYDTETELKQKYNITYQHTFVQVDEAGNEITKWNGGQTEEILANIK